MDRVVDLVDYFDGVHVRQLPPLTKVLVRTRNSLYRIVVAEGFDVFVQGGTFFPDCTSAYLEGASMGGGFLKVGCIGVGLQMEIQVGTRRLLTSPVVAIATERSGTPVVH